MSPLVTSAAALLLLALATAVSAASPFGIRGVKGLWWSGIDNYQHMVRWLPDHDLNFLMFCYSSFPGSGSAWRQPYTAAELAGMGEVASYGREHGVDVCLSINPAIWSRPALEYGGEADLTLLADKCAAAHAVGVRSFALCLDDISEALGAADQARFPSLAEAQAHLVNALLARLRALDPAIRLIFCPSAYTTGSARANQPYITTVGRLIDPAVIFFWTGPQVCSPSITAADADEFAGWIGRQPLIWDNYPVNDYCNWRLLLSPVKHRAADLGAHVAGLMSNPMRQSEISKLPLATLAAYLHDPAGYQPDAALAAALHELGRGELDGALRDLVQLYGRDFLGEPPPPPPATAGELEARVAKLKELAAAFGERAGFERLCADVAPAIAADLRRAEARLALLGPAHPLPVTGHDFAGGAGEVYGFAQHGRDDTNFVYAANTPHGQMTARFLLAEVDANAHYEVTVEAHDDDFESKAHVRLTLNDTVLLDGVSDWPDHAWATRTFRLPGKALRAGENRLTVACTDPQGQLGMPPWFMVAKVDVKRVENE
ncbi:MAG: beta-N-acetylglucosaminidase domain-containing protein [Armatimonadetes bacterium]|nr:beta-N-acetylglucosaminidase domain-containing protein [Armatimonadota bacterium]